MFGYEGKWWAFHCCLLWKGRGIWKIKINLGFWVLQFLKFWLLISMESSELPVLGEFLAGAAPGAPCGSTGSGSAPQIPGAELPMAPNRCFAFKGHFNFLSRPAPRFPERASGVQSWNVGWHQEWNSVDFLSASWVIQPNLAAPTSTTTGRACLEGVMPRQSRDGVSSSGVEGFWMAKHTTTGVLSKGFVSAGLQD